MKANVLRLKSCAIAALLILGFNSHRALGQAFNISPGSFTTSNVCQNSVSPAPGCQVLTNGSPNFPTVVTGGILQLNSANVNQHASAWYLTPEPLASGFTTSFQFQITKTGAPPFSTFPADGIALVIQNDPAGTAALGYTGNGQNISYGNDDQNSFNGPGEAILNSLAVELDTYQNSDYGDPDNDHIAVQSCGPNTAGSLLGISSDHNYICSSGNPAKLALQSLIPLGLSLSDGNIHTITVNYSAPGTCTSACNNFTVYLDSTQILQTTVNLATQLNLASGANAFIGLTASTGGSVENNNIISWSYSQWPLNPITIPQPLQPTVTNFSYTQTLSSTADYSQSGLPGSDFTGLVMQGTVEAITDAQYANLVLNTPFQGSSCMHQDTSGSGTYSCVVTTDLCTTSTNPNPSGANCPNTGQSVLIGTTNTFNPDPSQKPFVAPAYLMGSDNALGCPTGSDNTCKGLINIFQGISGDATTVNGKTNNFNSSLFPALGVVQPQTSINTVPPLNQGWTNQSVTLTFNSADIVPTNNSNPPSPLPTVASINYSVTGSDVPAPSSGTFTGNTGSVMIPATVAGTTTVTYYGTDTGGTVETVITNTGTQVNSAPPSLTIKTDLTPPTASCTANGPTSGWQAMDVTYACTASDSASGLANSSQSSFTLSTNIPTNTETATANIAAVQVLDVAGNSATVGPYGPFEVDKKAPVINAPTISPASPTYGQSVTANYSCTDGGSGVVLCGPTGAPNIPPTANTGALSSPVDGSVGTHTFTVNSQDAVGNVSAASSVTYTVAKAAPTVTFTGAPASAAYQSTFTVTTTTNSSTTAVITAAGACSVSGNTVTMTSGTGTCSLTANWAADNNYLAATLSQSTSATLIAPTVTFTGAPASAPYKSNFAVAATTNASATAVISAVGACSIVGNGVTMTSGTGACMLTASWAADSNYSAATATQSTSATMIAPTVTFTGTPSIAAFGSSFAVSATTNASTTPVISAAGACSIAGNMVTMTSGTGTCAMTAAWAADSNYSSATAAQSTTASKAGSTAAITSNSPNPSGIGQSVSVGFKVTGVGIPTGSVTVTATTGESCTGALSAGAGSCSITFNTGGSRTLAAVYPGDANFLGSSSSSVNQTVNGALLSISPTSVNFGTPFIFTTSKQTITLTNTGSSTLTLNSVTLATADQDDWTLSNPCGSSLNAGKSCSLVLSFFGDEVGSQSATITITDNAPNSPQQVGATVNVIAPAGLLTPVLLNFGKVKAGTSATSTLTLSNVGLTSLSINSITSSGTGFTQTNNCPSSLAVYASCTITVKFAPTAKTSYSGAVTVTDNGLIGKQVSILSGTGN